MIGTSIFLLPNGTFFVELAVFVAIFLIAKRYIFPVINKMLVDRQEKIRTSLEAADAARAEAAAADDERATSARRCSRAGARHRGGRPGDLRPAQGRGGGPRPG